MKLHTRERGLSLAVGVLTAVVLILAVLQYRWTNQVSEATAVRLADSLRMSMIGWHLDLFRNIAEVCLTMRANPEVVASYDPEQYVRGYEEWKKAATYPDLVAAIYLAKPDNATGLNVLRLNPALGRFQPIELPSRFSSISAELEQQSSILLQTTREQQVPPGAKGAPSAAASGASVTGMPLAAAPPPKPNLQLAEHYYRVGDPLAGWQFEPNIPALFHPIVHTTGAAGPHGANRLAVDWIVIELSAQVLRDRVFPGLAQRYFLGTEGVDYQVAVLSGNNPRRLLYSSDSTFGTGKIADADAVMHIFVDSDRKIEGAPLRLFHDFSGDKSRDAFVGTSWFPLLRMGTRGTNWRLIVRHLGKSHGAFVAEMRRRDLTISFGVLMSLAISIGIVIATSNRAQRLASVQMDFVTTVSHELRTPLAVISSAADNLVDGVVNNQQQFMEYGAVIKNQSRQLSGMVENILLFTSTRNGQQHYSLALLDVQSVVDSALANTAAVISAAGFRVERDFEAKLPQVKADRAALIQCLQNLITNAVKYGGEARWIKLQARSVITESEAGEVQISISDRGIGIGKADIEHIFEPFYRSPSVTAAQIHGTGLGLPLAKGIAEAMGGRISVRSTPGHGSTFTLHLPGTEISVGESGLGESGSGESKEATDSLGVVRSS